MGMYDTFRGEYICPDCGNAVKFEEQTKDYGCYLDEFYLGDYVEDNEKNYFYEFKSLCKECNVTHDISLAIRRSQFVGIYFKQEADKINIMDLDNIEKGYRRNRDYDKMCEAKLGYETFGNHETLKQKHVGELLDALRTRWKVKEVYKEVPVNGEKDFFYRENFIYRVFDGESHRIIEEEINGFTSELIVLVCEDTFEQKANWEEDDWTRRFILQRGCELIRIE